MKTFWTCVIASLLWALTNVGAAPLVLSSSIGLSAQGNAGAYPSYGGGGQSYSEQNTSPLPLGAFANSVSGTADWSIPNQPGFFLPPIAHATSSANAVSLLSLTSSGFAASLSGGVAANINAFVGGPVMYENASASVIFGLTFTLAEASVYSLDLNYDAMHGHGFSHFLTLPQFSFTSMTQGALPGVTLVRSGAWNWTASGSALLPADTYTMSFRFDAGVAMDPLGDFESGSYRANLAVASIPDTGSAVLLLGSVTVCMAAALAIRRRRSR